jgi:hypothetical protein
VTSMGEESDMTRGKVEVHQGRKITSFLDWRVFAFAGASNLTLRIYLPKWRKRF